MSNAVKNAVKTVRDAAATAGILLGAFGLPALMAGGVALPSLVPDEAVEWMGTGDNDPLVSLSADQLAEITGTATADVAPSKKKSGEESATESAKPAPKGDGSGAKTAGSKSQKSTSSSRNTRRASLQTGDGGGAEDGMVTTTPGSARRISAAKLEAYKARNAAKAKGRRCNQPIDGVKHVSGDRYTVERQLIERYDSMDAALGLARVTWNKGPDGKKDGFKLYRVACGSPLTQVGFRAGDVIHRINGKKIRSLPQAYMAIRKVRRNDTIQVDFSRGGSAMKRVVNVL